MKSQFLLIKDEIEEELENIKTLKNDLNDIKDKDLESEMQKRLYASILSDFYMLS